MCHLYGDFLCELYIEKTGKNSHLSFGNKPDILQLRDLYSLLVVFNSCAKCQKYSQLGGCFIFAKSYFDFYETLCVFSSLEAFVNTNRKMRLKVTHVQMGIVEMVHIDSFDSQDINLQ